MTSYFKTQNLSWLLFLMFLVTSMSIAQKDVEKWKFQLALGVNNTVDQVETPGYFSKQINFPTINLGVQYMFTNRLGAKLDLGYNRSSEAKQSLPYKLNYTRINAQAVYDVTPLIGFLPERINLVAHAGPGISMTKPLGDASKNTYNYLNVLGGFELHYQVTESLSVFVDGAYALALTNNNKYDAVIDGFSFNGDLAYMALGVSFSLGRCNYCPYPYR